MRFSLLVSLAIVSIEFCPFILSAQVLPPSPVPPVATPSPTPHKQVLPLPPADLLALLPKAPDKWELRQSQANNFMMVWATSQATREFSYTPPPDAVSPGGTPSPPLALRITIVDTGYSRGSISEFEKSTSAKPGTVQSLTLAGFPARQSPSGAAGERLRILVNGRYIVQIDAQNQPANTSQQWLRIVDMAKISTLPTDGDGNLPRPYTIVKIDEMNPKNNSVSQVTWATQEELDRTSRRRR